MGHKVDVVCLREPLRARGDIGISHVAYETRNRNRVWTAVQMGRVLVVDERAGLCRGANDDVIATEVRRTGEKITTRVDVYDQEDALSGERN